jgi:hypothetical protein
MGIAHERAKGKLRPVSSWGVEKSRRSAAPQRTIFCASIHPVNQQGKVVEGTGNSYLHILYSEPVEKVTFSKTASSAGSKIRKYFLSSKVFTVLAAMFLGLWGQVLNY